MVRTVSRKHAAVVYSPSSYVRQKVSRAARSALMLLRRASIALGTFIVWLLGLITYLNIVPSIARLLKPRRQRRKRCYDATDSVVYVAGCRDRFIQFFSTELANRKRLLQWVKVQAPSLHHLTNLSSQWCDGTALCVLVNGVVAGTCPRHDLLRREHAVNNCRLATRLVQRNLGIREPMTSEEMADPKRINEQKMVHYISSIKNAIHIPIEEPEAPIKLPASGAAIEPSVEKECTASGSGLVVAVVDKRARFTITTQTYKYKNLYVEITGPNREKVRRKIVMTKVNRGCLIKAGSSQSSKDEPHPEDDGPPEPIPLDYQTIKPGSYQVNYIPRSLGMYQVAITWGGEHIKNSPFKVRSTTAKNIEQTAVRSVGVVKAVSFQDDQDLGMDHEESELPAQSDTDSTSFRSRRQSLVRQAHISTLRDSYESAGTSPFSSMCSSMCSSMVSSMDHSIDNTSDVFLPNHHGHSPGNYPYLSRHSSSMSTASSRSGSILSRSSSIMHSTDRPPTVKTRRKVIRRIIKGAGGTEEVTYPNVRSSSILSSSQMSSMTSTPSMSTSMSIDDRSLKFSTSSSSSGASAPFHHPPGVKIIDPSEMYADHMSKILLSKAFNALAKQITTNSMAIRQCENEKDRGESHRSTDEKPSTVEVPGNVNGKPSTSRNISHSEEVHQCQTQPNAGNCNNLHSSCPAATSQTNSTHRDEQTDVQNKSRQSTEQTQNSTEMDQYLKYKNEFLRDLETESRSGDPKHQKASNNQDKSVGTTDRSPYQASAGATSFDTSVRIRRAYKKRKEDKATQCTAQDIKTATGWISRRTMYRSAQINNVQKDSNGDSALGESEGSVVNSSADKDNVQARTNRITRRFEVLPGSAQSRGAESSACDLDQGSRSVGAPVQHRRGQSGTQGSSQGRQSTFDSGFSDENGHNVGQEHRRNADEIRGRRGGLMANGKPENIPSSSVPDTKSTSVINERIETATKPNMSNGHANSDETRVEQPTLNPDVPIEIVPPSPIIKPSADNFRVESTNPETLSDLIVKLSSDNEAEKEDLVSGQYLTVDNPFLDSSTAPTPGDSSVGNISSPDEDTFPSADCKSNISSDVPDGKFPSALCDNLSEGASAREPPGDNMRLEELSLDAMLQTLENDPEYSTRQFLRKYRPMMGDELGILAQLPSVDPDENECQRRKPDRSSYNDNGTASKNGSVTTPSQPIPERCHASGVGLYNAIVGVKNNFQVRTLSAGDGSLSVTIRGPQPHTVNETTVVYTGDDLYEIIYDVSLAGFYVISVRWADKHVPDSPFIVKVTF